MAVSLAEISAEVEVLKGAVATEKQQVADLLAQKEAAIAAKDAAIATLDATVAQLQALVTSGGTPEERQALLDKLVSATADVNAIV